MTSEEIEQEVQARVEFKLNELLTGLKNRVGFKYSQAFDMTRESEQAWKSFSEISGMMKKEIEMGTPSNRMADERKRKTKDIAVDNIMKYLRPILVGIYPEYKVVNLIVKEIEKAQNY